MVFDFPSLLQFSKRGALLREMLFIIHCVFFCLGDHATYMKSNAS